MQTLILGGIGMGKTYHARSMLSRTRRRFILDPRGEHRGDVVCNNLDQLFDTFDTETTLFDHTIVYRDVDDEEDAYPAVFELMCKMRRWCILVDEADEFCSPHGWTTQHFRKLVNYRRHFQLDLILVARRAADVHPCLVSCSDEVHLFKTHLAGDLKRIAAECGQEWADKCRDIPERTFLRKVFVAKPQVNSVLTRSSNKDELSR